MTKYLYQWVYKLQTLNDTISNFRGIRLHDTVPRLTESLHAESYIASYRPTQWYLRVQ